MTRNTRIGDYGFYVHNDRLMYHYNDLMKMEFMQSPNLIIYAQYGKVIAIEQNGKYTRRGNDEDLFHFAETLFSHYTKALDVASVKLEFLVQKEHRKREEKKEALRDGGGVKRWRRREEMEEA